MERPARMEVVVRPRVWRRRWGAGGRRRDMMRWVRGG